MRGVRPAFPRRRAVTLGRGLMNDFRALFLISLAAVLAPLLNRIPALKRMPLVAIELMLGVVLGPGLAGLVVVDPTIDFLKELGLVFLFFQAGFEARRHEISLPALRLGAKYWFFAFSLAVLFASALYAVGLVKGVVLLAIILPTTAFGILVPILKQGGEMGTRFGDYLLGAAAFGELGPLLFASIALAAEKHHLHQAFSSLFFLALAIGSIFLLIRFISRLHVASLSNWLRNSGVFPVRAAVLVLLGYVALANNFGMETVAGAYAAGLVVAVLESVTRDSTLEDRLTSIGSGFLIPVFFIASGITYDLQALVSDGASIAQFVLFCIAFLSIRLVPLFFYRGVLSGADLPALALMTAATLPLVVAISYLGVQSGQIRQDTATALVGAAFVTVTAFPSFAQWLRAQADGNELVGLIDRGCTTLANAGANCYYMLDAAATRISFWR